MLYRSLCCFATTGLFIVAQTALTAAAELKILTTPALTEVWEELGPNSRRPGTSSPSSMRRPVRSQSA